MKTEEFIDRVFTANTLLDRVSFATPYNTVNFSATSNRSIDIKLPVHFTEVHEHISSLSIILITNRLSVLRVSLRSLELLNTLEKALDSVEVVEWLGVKTEVVGAAYRPIWHSGCFLSHVAEVRLIPPCPCTIKFPSLAKLLPPSGKRSKRHMKSPSAAFQYYSTVFTASGLHLTVNLGTGASIWHKQMRFSSSITFLNLDVQIMVDHLT